MNASELLSLASRRGFDTDDWKLYGDDSVSVLLEGGTSLYFEADDEGVWWRGDVPPEPFRVGTVEEVVAYLENYPED